MKVWHHLYCGEGVIMGKDNLTLVSMNLIPVAIANNLSLHVLVKRVESGHFMASVSELADCVSEAETRSAAIALVQEKVKARLLNIEVLTLEVPNNPWTRI